MSGSSPKRSSVDIRLGLGGLLQHLRGSGERSFPNCRSLRGETSVSYRALRTFSTTSQYRNRWTCSRPHAGWSVAYELRPFVLYGSQNIWSRWQELEPLSYLHNPPLNLRPRCISLGNLKMKRIVMDLGSSILCRHPKARLMLLNLASHSVVPHYELLSTFVVWSQWS